MDLYIQLYYAVAKTLAEKEATEFAAKEGLDLVVVNPSFVVGASLSPVPTSSVQMIQKLLSGTLICKHAHLPDKDLYF